MRGHLLLIAAATVQSGCAEARTVPALVEGQPVVVTGPVAGVDLRSMPLDGDGLIVIQSEQGARVTVHVPSGERACEAAGLDLLQALRPGDRVRVRGIALGAAVVGVCDSSTSIERL